MRKFRTGGMAVLLLGLATSVVTAQQPADKAALANTAPDSSGHWWDNLFGKPKPEEKKPEPKPTPSVASRTAELKRQLHACQRRQAICDRLAEIGREKNDEALQQEAARLHELAFRVYQQQSERLLGRITLTDDTALRSAASPTAVLSGEGRTDGGQAVPTASRREGTR